MSEIKTAIQECDTELEPIGVIQHPTGLILPNIATSNDNDHGYSLPISTNLSSAETSSKSINYKVFEQISGVISAEFLSVLPGNPLQVFESIVSEYGERLCVKITGNSKNSTLEILIHAKNLWTLFELEAKLNALMTRDDQTTSEEIIDSELIEKESSKSLSVFEEKQKRGNFTLLFTSPNMTRKGRLVITPPPKMTCKGGQVKIPSPKMTCKGGQVKTPPPKMTCKGGQVKTPSLKMTCKGGQVKTPSLKITRKGRQVKTPKRLVSEPVKPGKELKPTPVKIAVENEEEIPVKKPQESEEMSLVSGNIINTDNEDECIAKVDPDSDSNKQDTSDDDPSDEDIPEDEGDCSATETLPQVKRIHKRKMTVPVRHRTEPKQPRTADNTTGRRRVKRRHPAWNTKRFYCSKCSFRASTFCSMSRHRAGHKKNAKIFRCSHCDFATTSRINKSRHDATHITERLKCDLCPYETHSESLFVSHRAVKHKIDKSGQKYFECPVCSHTCPRLRYKLFYTHLKTHPDIKDSDIMKDLESLIERKNKGIRHVCDICGYQTRHRSEMKRHHQQVHCDNRSCLCDVCGKAFKTMVSLKTHIRSHLKVAVDMPFKFYCTKCSFRCKRLKNFQRHQKGHDERNLKIYKCPDCEFSCLSSIQLSKHTIIHCEDRFDCEFCSFQTHLLITMKNHVKKKHKKNENVKYYNCPSCDFKIPEVKKNVYMSHLETHPELKDSEELKAIRHKVSLKFKCYTCQFMAQTSSEVTAHKNAEHKNSEQGEKVAARLRSFGCHLCPFKGKTKAELITHRTSEHGIQSCDKLPRVRSFKCLFDLCQFKGQTNAELTTHQNSEHAGLKPYTCDNCEASYQQKADLQNHRKMKHPEIYGLPQHACNLCDVKCATKARLKRHVRHCHDRDTAVFCDICGLGLPNRHQRHKHMKKVHKIGIPCCHCDKFFKTRQGLSRHMRKKHVNTSETTLEVTPEVNTSESECLEVSTEVDNFISVMEVWETHS